MHTSSNAFSRRNGTPKEYIPDFFSWKVTELKDECKRLGLAPSRRLKEGLVGLLNEYYTTHDMRCQMRKPEVIIISDTESEASSTSVEIVETLCTQPDSFCTETDLSGALSSLQLENTSSLSSSPSSAPKETDDVFSEKPNSMDKPMCNAIFANKKLHMRVLLMEPISLDEFYGVAESMGVFGTSKSVARKRAKLRAWLDSQGICFYEAELA